MSTPVMRTPHHGRPAGERAAEGQQAHHPDHQLALVLKAVEDRAVLAGEGFATDPTSPAIAKAIVDLKIAGSNDTS